MTLALGAACARTLRPAPPAAPTQPQATGTKPPPTSAPKCASLDEKCTAAAGTQCNIGDTGAWFRPPEGWLYAQDSAGAIAQASDGLSAMAFATTPAAAPKDVASALDAILAKLHVTHVKTKKLEKRLKKPQSTVDAGDTKVELWEVDKDKQGDAPELDGKKGALLVIVIAPSGSHAFVGASFVVKPEAEDRAAAILEAVQSFRGSK